MDCWFERVEIEDFIKGSYSIEEQQKIFAPPKDRLTSIFDIIAKVSAKSDNQEK